MQDVDEVGVLDLGDGAKVVHDNLGPRSKAAKGMELATVQAATMTKSR